MSHQTMPHRLERLKMQKSVRKSIRKLATVFLGNRSIVKDLGGTQPDYQRV